MADRSVLVRLRADISNYQAKLATAGASTNAFVKQLDTADSRMGNLVQTALALAPAMVPIGSIAVPAVAGLSTQLGSAAAGAGVMVAAFNGVGDAIGAVNDYRLKPTTENLLKMEQAMAQLPAEGREFVRFLDSEVMPALDRLQDVSAGGVLPGTQDGIESLLTRLPQVRRIVAELAQTSGDLMAQGGAELASEDWDEFFDFLESEARPKLLDFSRTVGNVVEGVANTLMGLDPLADQFSGGLLSWSRDFADATENLDESEGFQRFVDYVRDNGPEAVETLGDLGGAVVSLVEAAAPVGAATLPVIQALAEVLSAVAESPAGPVLISAAAGISAVSRAVALYKAANGSALMGFLTRGAAEGSKAGAGFRVAGAGVGVMALALTDLDDSLGVSNTAMGAAMGLMVGPWGAAVGGTAGLLLDLAAAGEDSADAISALNRAIASGDVEDLERQIAAAEDALDEALNPDTITDWAVAVKDGLRIIAQGGDDAGTEVDRLRTKIDDARDALGELEGQDALSDLFADGLGLTEDALDAASESADEFVESLAAVNRALEGRADARDFQAALDDFDEALGEIENKRRLLNEDRTRIRIDIPEGREIEAQLDGIASSALAVAENLQGTRRINFLDRARDDFIDAARDLGLTAGAAERLADKLGLLEKADPKIDVDNKPARGKIREAEDWIEAWAQENGEAAATVDIDPAREGIQTVEDLLNGWDNDRGDATVDVRDQASGVLGGVLGLLNAVDGYYATATIRTERINITTDLYRRGHQTLGGLQEADGGIHEGGVKTFADGGWGQDGRYYTRVPQIVRGGANILWGEEETGWEAYISGKPSMRDRNIAILGEAASRLGYSVSKLADGGFAGVPARLVPSQAPAPGGGSVTIPAPQVSLAGLTLRANVEGLGDVMFTIADEVVGSYRTHDARQAATVYSGVSDD